MLRFLPYAQEGNTFYGTFRLKTCRHVHDTQDIQTHHVRDICTCELCRALRSRYFRVGIGEYDRGRKFFREKPIQSNRLNSGLNTSKQICSPTERKFRPTQRSNSVHEKNLFAPNGKIWLSRIALQFARLHPNESPTNSTRWTSRCIDSRVPSRTRLQ